MSCEVESGGDDSPESEGAWQCALTFRNGGARPARTRSQGEEGSSPSRGKNSALFNLNDTFPLRAWEDPSLKIYDPNRKYRIHLEFILRDKLSLLNPPLKKGDIGGFALGRFGKIPLAPLYQRGVWGELRDELVIQNSLPNLEFLDVPRTDVHVLLKQSPKFS